jgi:hypothetical protein
LRNCGEPRAESRHRRRIYQSRTSEPDERALVKKVRTGHQRCSARSSTRSCSGWLADEKLLQLIHDVLESKEPPVVLMRQGSKAKKTA